MIFRVDRDWQIKLLWICSGKSGVAIGAPLHRCPAAVAIAEIKIIAHPDLISVIDDRSTGHREEQGVEQLNLAAAVCQQRRKTPANPEINPSVRIGSVNSVHVVA